VRLREKPREGEKAGEDLGFPHLITSNPEHRL
jgi:hypothetical protein